MESTTESTQSQKTYSITNGQKASILIVMLFLLMINYADRAILSVTLQQIKVDLALTDVQLGAIQTSFQIMVGLLTIPLGWFIDRWSRRKLAAIMALLWSVTTFLTGVCQNFISLLFVRAAVGLGEDGFTTLGGGWLSLAFSKAKRSMVAGIFGLGGTAGTALGMIVGGMIVTATGMWQMPFFIFAIPGIIFGIWAFFLKDFRSVRKEGESAFNKEYFTGWLGVFKIPSFLLTAFGHMCFGMMTFTWAGWLPAFMMRSYDISAAQAGSIVGAAALMGILGALAFGFATDAWYRKNKNARIYMMTLAQFVFACMTGAAIYFMGSIPISAITIILFVSMFAVGGATSMIFAVTMDVTPVSHRFSAYGAFATIVFLGGAIGPSIVGAISDAVGGGAPGIRMGFLWLLPASFIAVILYGIEWIYYRRDSQKVTDDVLAEK
ncbi:MAG: MFS transporter [Dehalococcoidia bacterium]